MAVEGSIIDMGLALAIPLCRSELKLDAEI
jgi:hypothetical protein